MRSKTRYSIQQKSIHFATCYHLGGMAVKPRKIRDKEEGRITVTHDIIWESSLTFMKYMNMQNTRLYKTV